MLEGYSRLVGLLGQARRLGFLGAGPVEAHVEHAKGFVEALGDNGGPFLDLGSGAGLPGLVIALQLPELEVVLLDASSRRAGFLRGAVEKLGIASRVKVVSGRAETLGRDAGWRGLAGAVAARSFGTPAVTAECAAPFLRQGGSLVVSESPDGGTRRWPSAGLALLGLGPPGEFLSSAGYHFVVMEQVEACPERFPRRNGVPAKRPLF